MKRILAATDFSGSSHHALARAAQLARAHAAELHTIYVPAHGRWPQGSGVLAQYLPGGNVPTIEEDRQRLADEAARIARRFRVHAEAHVVPGKPAEEISAFATVREIDLVVVGSRGQGRLRAQAIGSTVLKVLWSSLVPVLMVRQPVDIAYRKVLVATDLGDRSLHVGRTALAMFPKASVSLLHAFRGEFETTLGLVGARPEEQRRYVTEAGEAAAIAFERFGDQLMAGSRRKVARVLAHSHPIPAIQKAVAELKPDLVVLGKHSGARWEELVLGSVVQNLLQQLKTDVLVVA